MGLRDEGGINKLPPGDLQLGQTSAPISSLNEAWLNTLDRCVNDMPLSEVILPLMRNCFFGGAIHAVLLLQKGHDDHVASDIASFIMEDPQSCPQSDTPTALTFVETLARASSSDAADNDPKRNALVEETTGR